MQAACIVYITIGAPTIGHKVAARLTGAADEEARRGLRLIIRSVYSATNNSDACTQKLQGFNTLKTPTAGHRRTPTQAIYI